MPSFATQLREYVAARASGIWIVSEDHEEAMLAIERVVEAERWELFSWDEENKVRRHFVPPQPNGPSGELVSTVPAGDFIELLPKLHHAIPEREDGTPSSRLLVLRNFTHRLLSPDTIARVANAMSIGKRCGSFIVVLTSRSINDSTLRLGGDIQSQFVVIDHPLPNREQLAEIARSVELESAMLTEEAMPSVVDAALGLTYSQAELAFSLSIVNPANGQKIVPAAVWDYKSQMLQKSEALTLYKGQEKFADLGGLTGLKDFCMAAIRTANPNPLARPRGVLLIGPPGTGKTGFCKALGNEVGRPTIRLDCGALRGRYQGDTEEATRRCLKVIDAMGKVILFVDEIEKALSGSESSGAVDGGTGARMMGTLLTWMNDHTSAAFLVASCNSLGDLPPAFTRAERTDGIFFLDLPTKEERRAIWTMYLKLFELSDSSVDDLLKLSNDWTGAEIRACCRLAAMLGKTIPEASTHIIPTAVTDREGLEELRKWADQRVLSARTGRQQTKVGTVGGDGVALTNPQRRRNIK